MLNVAITDAHRHQFENEGYALIPSLVKPTPLRKEALKRVAMESILFPNRNDNGQMCKNTSCIYEVCPSAILSDLERNSLSEYIDARRAIGLRNATTISYVTHGIARVVQDLLISSERASESSTLSLLNEQYIVKSANGGHGTAFGWHQDSTDMPEAHQKYVSVWIALDDCNEENGTLYVRNRNVDRYGTITAHTTPPNAQEQGVPLLFNAGDAIIMSSTLWHRSGPNISGFTRHAFMPQYVLSTARNKRNPGVALDIALSP
eukprot:CFRG7831T1